MDEPQYSEELTELMEALEKKSEVQRMEFYDLIQWLREI